MNTSRLWILGGALLAIAVLAGGYFLGVSPALAAAKVSTETAVSVEMQNAQHARVLAELREQSKTIDKAKKELTVLQEALPPGADYSGFIKQIVGLAASSGVAVTSITAADAQIFVGNADPATAPTDPSAEAIDPAADPDGAGPATPTVAEPVQDTGMVAIPITITVTGSSESIFSFMDALRLGARLYLIHDFSVATAGDSSEGSIVGLAYVMPSLAPAAPTGETNG